MYCSFVLNKTCLLRKLFATLPHGYLTPSWNAFSCSTRLPFRENYWSHCLQGYLTDSWNTLLCLARFPFWESCLQHHTQRYLIPLCVALLCLVRFPFWENWRPPTLKGYLTPSCNALLCSTRIPFWENCWPHYPQGYLTPLYSPFVFIKFSFLRKKLVVLPTRVFDLFCVRFGKLLLSSYHQCVPF